MCRGDYEARLLSAQHEAELLEMSERTFRRYRRCREEERLEGLFDRRLGKGSSRRVPVDQVDEAFGLVTDWLTLPEPHLRLLMMDHCTGREAEAFFLEMTP